jgi:protein-tyrosine kinase
VSIVEKALQKLQSNRERDVRRTSAPSETVSVGTVAPHPTAAARTSHAEPPRPSKIVHVDRDALRRVGLMPPESSEKELGHQYRAIKRPLIRSAYEPVAPGGMPRRLIMVASALPGEGKTFTSINLALSLSLEKDHSVLLVDADIAKGHVSRVFGAEKEPGLLDVLGDTSQSVGAAIESVILGTDVPRLSILPAGRRSETAAEFMASARMREVVQHLAARDPHGIVVFDSSPILLTSEARVLASLVGQVVLVVAAGMTPQQAVKDAVGSLDEKQKVSLVLNQAEITGPLSYYYGYGYGYGEESGPKSGSG